MPHPDSDGAIDYALTRLTRELSADYLYHDIAHTRDHVLPAAARLAELSGCSADEIQLVQVAAAFHDLGLVEIDTNHELVGARLAAQRLPDFGFGPRAVEQVMGMILATRLPQQPRTLLEQILADADLDVLGRDDFFTRNSALRRELARMGRPMTDHEWYSGQLAFIENHTYFTDAARTLHAAGKQANTDGLRARLQGASP